MPYYEEHANEYIEKTFDVDMSSPCDLFLKRIPEGGYILDVGFGSGRDSLYFKNRGYQVLGIDVVPAFVDHAKGLGLEAKLLSVLDLDYQNTFDGVYASASLLHLGVEELKAALKKIKESLKVGGILYMSFKYGTFAGFRDSRYYLDMTLETMKPILEEIGLDLLSTKIEDDRLGRGNRWIEFLARKSH